MKQIKLTRPHIHAGISYAFGDVIDVTDADAVYLIRHQIGTAVKSAVKKSDKSDKPAAPPQTDQPGNNAKAESSTGGKFENQNQGEK